MIKIKQVKSFFLQTLIITSITCILSEITFRIYHKINPTFLFPDQSYNRWRGKPHSQDFEFTLNSKGFKDVEYPLKTPAGTYRIIGIGDSFSFGIVPYQHNYLTLLEEKLNQNNQKIELINMGIPGMGPKDYLSLLINEGLEYQPDMVLLSFYIGNDFMDNQFKAKERVGYQSYVISFVRSLIKLQTQYEGLVFNPNNSLTYVDNAPTQNDEFYLKDTKNKSNMFVKNPADDIFESYVEDAVSDIIKIKEICDYRNIKLVVVIIPDEVQVDQKLQAKIVERFDSDDPDKLDFRIPNRMLQETFQQNKIDYIDVMDEFITASSQQRLYKPNDTHWNIAGNQLAADVLFNNLYQKYPHLFR
ncbi:SGNH/GDSL hydrolase family protein [Limnoraphis robusta]|uniref:SGNH/GDSL hydrolase family protein n=1 Tax=Limnoraphis robusta CCNP1315 TaxID=3110306 RepID=A0ABU5TSU4_9CYAN|nr:SGNH/GDSL hydrolase family protein [Limnoraphis robusta]MEA5517975.1 SGNH/GDSL hydrolase family protein [Limnoraphis robusta CCNP1315]MEA5545547.1 SGNH/GDSL hydrolase family protein [Limnoraphis robusta CCNP1324]